jgi:hypothetical protein
MNDVCHEIFGFYFYFYNITVRLTLSIPKDVMHFLKPVRLKHDWHIDVYANYVYAFQNLNLILQEQEEMF